MQRKSLLIIGGTGFFGKSILKYFLSRNSPEIKINKIFILSRKKLKIATYNKKLTKKIKITKLDSYHYLDCYYKSLYNFWKRSGLEW